MKTFVIGDIHGAHKALIQCFDRSGFNPDKDRLIALGDVADGWSQTFECVEELIHIKNLIYIMGNHDVWLLDWLETGASPYIWTSQGGKATIASYIKAYSEHSTLVKERHQSFFSKAVFHHIDNQNRLFVHGGIAWHKDISLTSYYDKIWDRHMYVTACMWHEQSATLKFKDYKEIFIGHTTTSSYDKTLNPVHVANLWNLDQGAGWEGKLTIMNVNTHKYWQSDIVTTLYPEERGRR